MEVVKKFSHSICLRGLGSPSVQWLHNGVEPACCWRCSGMCTEAEGGHFKNRS